MFTRAVEITQDPRATMHWTIQRFCDFVFLAYGVKLVGWPSHIKFVNLSDVSMSTACIRALLNAWERGKMRWAKATPGELAAARENARNACPGPLFQDPLSCPRGGRNDVGKHRERPTVDSAKYPPWYTRDGPKSQRYIDSNEVEEIENADDWGMPHPHAGMAEGERLEDPTEPSLDDE
ncbi:hypothetical protein BN946_scf184985.g17 [Trametes cinnabarina]|uniref:Uncharacterized protein n=1 Tax=Pycnoporus cinnabarinus TaxID=5643 RepID=A0A060SJG9_PYCCI|nr:hypothetical protein BN946_scf184985.g17 [Trametes cinnabarina]